MIISTSVDSCLEHYYYQLGEFSICSELVLPELLTSPTPDTDIEFVLGQTPGNIREPDWDWDWTDQRLQLSGRSALYVIPDTASYLVENGRKITINPSPSAFQRDVRLFLLGTAFGILCHQRGAFPLHASAIIANNAAYAFVGPSGAGKSTIGAWLAARGHPLLSDDVCTLTGIDEHSPTVHPGAPRIKLWADALDALGISQHGLQRDISRTNKFHLIANQPALPNATPLRAIYLLEDEQTRQPHIEGPLDRLDAIATISDNTYRVELLPPMGLSSRHFQRCAALAKHTPVFRLHRPRKLPELNKVTEILEAHWS